MTRAAATSSPTLRQLVAPSLVALQRVRLPFTLLLLCGLGFVVSYYYVPPMAQACEWIAELKARYGYGFSAVGGLIAGVVVPELFKRITLPAHRFRHRFGEMLFDSFYFIFMAVLVDTLYLGLGMMFGTQVDFKTVAIKTAIDQFVFTPTLGTAIAAVYFPLRRFGWNFRRVFGGFGPNWYVRTVMPILLPAWVFWIPAVALTYSLPSLLQMPFSLCATAAWSLLLVVIARTEVSPKVKTEVEAAMHSH